jgi:hypothetical protein
MTLRGSAFRVVLDACVIYPMPLCDALLRFAAAGLYQPYWSNEILAEATRNLLADGRVSPEGAARRDGAVRSRFPESMVTGYESLTAAMPNQAKDRHVVAAAVKAGAELIVTFNLRDFTPLPDGIEASHPDDFLCDLLDLDHRAVIDVLRQQAAVLRKPPQTVVELLAKLGRRGAPRFAADVEALLADD